MNDNEWNGREIGREKAKEIIREIDGLKQSYHEDNFEVLGYTLNYLNNDIGLMIEDTKDNCDWPDLRRQVNHN